MTNKYVKNGQLAVINNVKWAHNILYAGLWISAIVIIAKISNIHEVSWQDIKITTDMAWLLFLPVTVIHLYTATLVTESIFELGDDISLDQCLQLWKEVRTTGGIFVRNMQMKTLSGQVGKSKIYTIKYTDPTSWVALLSSFLLIAAIVHFNLNDPIKFLALSVVALVLVYFNWRIGGIWMMALNALTIPRKRGYHVLDYYFQESTFSQAESIGSLLSGWLPSVLIIGLTVFLTFVHFGLLPMFIVLISLPIVLYLLAMFRELFTSITFPIGTLLIWTVIFIEIVLVFYVK